VPPVVLASGAIASGTGATCTFRRSVASRRTKPPRSSRSISPVTVPLERLRRERVVAAGALQRQQGRRPVARVLRDAFLPALLRRQGAEAAAWLHGHHIDWDAPVAADVPAARG